jgi:hypothetical protein
MFNLNISKAYSDIDIDKEFALAVTDVGLSLAGLFAIGNAPSCELALKNNQTGRMV